MGDETDPWIVDKNAGAASPTPTPAPGPYPPPPPGPYPPTPYGYAPNPGGPQPVPPYYYAPPIPTTDGMATAAMILGIVGIFTCGIGSILAIIFGHISMSRIKMTGAGGNGMALAGLILGYAVAAAYIVYIVARIIVASNDPYYYY